MASDSAQPIELVVGLGNPGAGHADDRHNVGYWFVEALASELNLQWRDESRYKGEFARAQSGIRFLKPSTFMNLSGESVAACANYFRIPVAGILIVHDELDLEPGVVRLKRGGGNGGHNGLRSIDSHLGDKNYIRARIGIGHPGSAKDVSAFVLSKPRTEERDAINKAMGELTAVFETLSLGQVDRAMNALNRRAKKSGGA